MVIALQNSAFVIRNLKIITSLHVKSCKGQKDGWDVNNNERSLRVSQTTCQAGPRKAFTTARLETPRLGTRNVAPARDTERDVPHPGKRQL